MGLTRADREAGRPSLTFRALNEGKQLIEIDLRSEAGRAALLALRARRPTCWSKASAPA